ncbi:MAG TPA: T9SS type A sorting domain-containing protein [archaeon]|nr:T9SS type A sorting domain-containing protein [archaeon]
MFFLQKKWNVKGWKENRGLRFALLGILLTTAAYSQLPRPVPVTVDLDPRGDQIQAAAIADSANQLLVVWRDSSTSGELILAQGFDRLGGRLSPISSLTQDNLFRGAADPSVAVDFDGTAVVAWSQSWSGTRRIYVRRYGMNGVPKGDYIMPPSEVRYISGSHPGVAADSIGDIILVWQEPSGASFDIFGTWIAYNDTVGYANPDSARFAWVGDVRINSKTAGDQTNPAVASDRKGNFLVAWRDSTQTGTGIFCRVFARKGLALDEFRLPLGDTLLPAVKVSPPSVAAAGLTPDSSHFLVSWIEEDQQGERELKLAKLSLSMRYGITAFSPDSTLWIISTNSSLTMERPTIAGRENGNIVLVWTEGARGGVDAFAVRFVLGQGPSDRIIRFTEKESGFGFPAAHPVAAVRQDGSFAVIWEDLSGRDVDLRMQGYTSAGNLEEPVYISPGGGADEISRYAALVSRPDSGFTVFWEKESPEYTGIQKISFSYSGRVDGLPGSLSPSDWEQRRPVAAQNLHGKYLVAWQERKASGYRVRTMFFTSGGSPVDTALITEDSNKDHLSGVAASISENGGGYLVWESWSPLADTPALVLARLDSLGALIGLPVDVVSSAKGGGRLASVAVGKEGRHMVVWRQGGSDGKNARIKGKLYGSQADRTGSEMLISADTLQYLGSAGHPVVASSPVTGDFLVFWQEFFSDRQRLYYRIYNSSGDSLSVNGKYRRQLDLFNLKSSVEVNQTNPTVAVDEAGDYLAFWVEKEIGGPARLLGLKIDSSGVAHGSVFKVPGVQMVALPEVSILGSNRIAVAWQDTVGGRIRLLAQALEIDLRYVTGNVALAAGYDWPVLVHLEGNVNDSVEVDKNGNFSFQALTEGSYQIRLSSNGQPLPAETAVFTLQKTDADTVNLGTVADLTALEMPELPAAKRFYLRQNVPNPFNPATTIGFEIGRLEAPVQVSLSVYDLRGSLVRNLLEKELGRGIYSVIWDGRDSRGRSMSSGVYFYRLRVGGKASVRKMVLLK